MPADQKARQGDVSNLAFQILGEEAAIAFLNAEYAGLGGRPLALATQSPEGDALVRAELERLGGPRGLERTARRTAARRPDKGDRRWLRAGENRTKKFANPKRKTED